MRLCRSGIACDAKVRGVYCRIICFTMETRVFVVLLGVVLACAAPAASTDSQPDLPRGSSLPDPLKDFSRELFQEGVYVLDCGGGVIPEPRWAILRLKRRYGETGLRDRCLGICALPAPAQAQLPEGVWESAHGVLFHLGDEATLAKLVTLHRANTEPEHALSNDANHHGLGSIETLVAALSRKLGLPPPEGVRPLTGSNWRDLFCPDNEPTFLNQYGFWAIVLVAALLGAAAAATVVWLTNCLRRSPGPLSGC